jgi:hypothetical protein
MLGLPWSRASIALSQTQPRNMNATNPIAPLAIVSPFIFVGHIAAGIGRE